MDCSARVVGLNQSRIEPDRFITISHCTLKVFSLQPRPTAIGITFGKTRIDLKGFAVISNGTSDIANAFPSNAAVVIGHGERRIRQDRDTKVGYCAINVALCISLVGAFEIAGTPARFLGLRRRSEEHPSE